jgi:hypothetical protein
LATRSHYEALVPLKQQSWAHWSLGNRRKAWGAMAGLIRQLGQQATGDRRFHEIFRKTQHALGWMEAVAKTGKPPAQAIDGRPYAEPVPGLFSRPRPHLADMSAPMLLHVLVSESVKDSGRQQGRAETEDTNPGTLPPDHHPRLGFVFATASGLCQDSPHQAVK